jgi:hypothetical protein
VSIQAFTALVTSISTKVKALPEAKGTPAASVVPREGIVANVTVPSLQELVTRRTSRVPAVVTVGTNNLSVALATMPLVTEDGRVLRSKAIRLSRAGLDPFTYRFPLVPLF